MSERTSSRAVDFRQMLENGVATFEEIEADARRLAEKMQRIHGAEYKIRVDHECGFVYVTRRR